MALSGYSQQASAQVGGEVDSSRNQRPSQLEDYQDGRQTRVVRTNRVQHHVQPQQHTEETPAETLQGANWRPPQTDHLEVPYAMEPERRYPQRNRRPPDWLRL